MDILGAEKMTFYKFLRTLDFRIKNIQESLDVSNSRYNFKDNRYSSPMSNPFFNRHPKTIVWLDELKK